jgi:hypothetical protein
MGCRTPAAARKARLVLKDRDPDDRDQLSWKWVKGAVTPKEDFGDPSITHTYAICIYDGSGLVSRAAAPAAIVCSNGRPCWREARSGFRYKNSDLGPEGLAKVVLKEGLEPGKAKVVVSGRGTLLAMPALDTLVSPVTVQVRNGTAVCWEAVFSAPFLKQDGTQFVDVGD